MRGQKGFTIIELMIALAVVAVLAGTVISRINYSKHKDNTSDALRKRNLIKLTEGIQAYQSINASKLFPTSSSDTGLTTYIVGGWLSNEPETGDTYTYATSASRTTYGITILLKSGRVYKYRSEWEQGKECSSGTTGWNDPASTVCP